MHQNDWECDCVDKREAKGRLIGKINIISTINMYRSREGI